MIPADIVEMMKHQVPEAVRPPEETPTVEQNLAKLAIAPTSEIAEFYGRYCLSAVLQKEGMELLDLCSPTPQIWEATRFARDVFEMPAEAVCLTSGDDEGFVFFSTRDSKIYDLDVAKIKDYEGGRASARWDSFYSLIRWYIS